MNPLWLILLLPLAATFGLIVGCLISTGAYERGYRDSLERLPDATEPPRSDATTSPVAASERPAATPTIEGAHRG
jgi:hypothetical protein